MRHRPRLAQVKGNYSIILVAPHSNTQQCTKAYETKHADIKKNPEKGKIYFFLLQNVQTENRVYPASYLMGRGIFTGGKEAGM
jgi:hypothetical protein